MPVPGYLHFDGKSIPVDEIWGTLGTWEELRQFIEEEDTENNMSESDWQELKDYLERKEAWTDTFMDMVKKNVYIGLFDEPLVAKMAEKYHMRHHNMPGWEKR